MCTLEKTLSGQKMVVMFTGRVFQGNLTPPVG